MDFLGIGPLELIVILVIALIVVGPERLPEVARSISKGVRQIRTITSAFTSEWQQELNAATHDITQDINSEEIQKALNDPLQSVSEDLRKALTAPSGPPAGGFVRKKTTQPGEEQPSGQQVEEVSAPEESPAVPAPDQTPAATPDVPEETTGAASTPDELTEGDHGQS